MIPVALVAIGIVVWIVVWLTSDTELGRIEQCKLQVGEQQRPYLLVPANKSRSATTAALVIALHGIGDTAQSMVDYSKLDRLALTSGFVLAIPEANNQMWKTILAEGETQENNPDVMFIDRLIAELEVERGIDRSRVYLIGMSNGATFAQLYAAHRPQATAAIVAHSGPRPKEIQLAPWRAPVMLVCGLDDTAITTIRNDYHWYQSTGQPTKMIEIQGLGHQWSTKHNQLFWQFLSQHHLMEIP